MKYRSSLITILAASAVMTASSAAIAKDKMTLYCSPQIEWCQLVIKEFQKATGIEVAMTRKSSGETFAQIKAGMMHRFLQAEIQRESTRMPRIAGA